MLAQDKLIDWLANDSELTSKLPGGFYHSTVISRQTTPQAFDGNQELLTCALLNFETETQHGPYRDSARLFFRITFYKDDSGDARQYVFNKLHQAQLDDTWEILWADDTVNAYDDALEARIDVSHYEMVGLK